MLVFLASLTQALLLVMVLFSIPMDPYGKLYVFWHECDMSAVNAAQVHIL